MLVNFVKLYLGIATGGGKWCKLWKTADKVQQTLKNTKMFLSNFFYNWRGLKSRINESFFCAIYNGEN